MPGKRKEPTDTRREPSDFVRRAASQGESRMALPHASLKRRAMGLMKQPLRTDLFRPARQPHDVEQVFVSRAYNFVEGGEAAPVPPPAAAEPPKAVLKRPAPQATEEKERLEPEIGLEDMESGDFGDDGLDLPPARPREANEALDLPDLEEYDGSDLFEKEDPDTDAEPAIPAEVRTELPSALRNRRNYYENSDQARKGGLLGGIMPGGGRPSAKAKPKRR